MRIDSSQIGMDSVRTYASHTAYKSGFQTSLLPQNETLSEQWSSMEETAEDRTGGSLDDLYDSFQNKLSTVNIQNTSDSRSARAMIGTIKQECLNYIFMLLFGDRQKAGFTTMADLLTADAGTGFSTSMQGTTYLNNTRQYIHMEHESTSFSTNGIVRTADGREINFGLEFQMSRSFARYYQENYTVAQVQTCDPLVINLDGNLAQLSDQKFTFDLDQDGILDRISRLNQGSGYLALDKNGDGAINDGSELFGTKSGDGFGDLRLYDEDGNGWIDENDEIFDKLLIWTQDEAGNDTLYHLKDAGVGAICLESVSTNFALNNAENATNGYIRQTGVFLYEDGGVGTMQHLDLAT